MQPPLENFVRLPCYRASQASITAGTPVPQGSMCEGAHLLKDAQTKTHQPGTAWSPSCPPTLEPAIVLRVQTLWGLKHGGSWSQLPSWKKTLNICCSNQAGCCLC